MLPRQLRRAEALHPILQDELFRIAREAISNAFRHARAKHIEVEVRFDGGVFRMRVRDDGIGMESNVMSGGRTGHWDLRGMRERADNIGAHLGLWSEVERARRLRLSSPRPSPPRAHHPDIVLMDLQLPDISGLDAMMAIRRVQRNGIYRRELHAPKAGAYQAALRPDKYCSFGFKLLLLLTSISNFNPPKTER